MVFNWRHNYAGGEKISLKLKLLSGAIHTLNCPWKTALCLDDNNKVMRVDKERQRSESLKVSPGCAGRSQSAEDFADIRRLCSA